MSTINYKIHDIGSSTFKGEIVVDFLKIDTTDYKVIITPSAPTGARLGDYWVEQRTNTSFVVRNTGGDIETTFDWIIVCKYK